MQGRGALPLCWADGTLVTAQRGNRPNSSVSIRFDGRLSKGTTVNFRSYYVPKTFYINYRYGILDGNGMPHPTQLPVFLHEITHLLQDQTTVSAGVDFVGFLDRVQDLRNVIIAGGKTLPLRSHELARNTWATVLDDLESLRRGSRPWPNKLVPWAFEEYRIQKEARQVGGEKREYPLPFARFVDNVSGEVIEQPIGTRELKEAYAIAVERIHGALEPDLFSEEFEYLAVERILSQFGRVTPQQTIAICHWALQDTFPGARFFELLELIKSRYPGTNSGSAEEWFDLVRTDSQARLKVKRSQLDQCMQRYITHYTQGLPSDPLLRTLRWYRALLLANLDVVASESRRFPLDTFLCQKPNGSMSKVFGDLSQFLTVHPLPQIEDGAGLIYSYGAAKEAEEGVFILRAMAHAYDQLWNGDRSTWTCPFEKSCSTVLVPHKNWVCETDARLKGGVKPLCPYGAGAFYVDAHKL
jgi:hypothetical protein